MRVRGETSSEGRLSSRPYESLDRRYFFNHAERFSRASNLLRIVISTAATSERRHMLGR
jgi:hypothetical protein